MEKAQFDIYNKIDPDADIRVAFDKNNHNWQYSPEYNHHFVRVMMNHMYDKLRANGYLFLNDVLERLGIEPTPEGQLLGWDNEGKLFDFSFTSNDEGGWIVFKNAKFIWHTIGRK